MSTRRPPPGRSVLLVVLLSCLSSLRAAAPVRADSARVEILDFGYTPGEIVVPATVRVTWQNRGEVTHTVVVDEVANSGDLNPGAVFIHAFDTPGTFTFRCSIHPSMRGVVRVTDAPVAAEPPTPAPAPAPAPAPSNPPRAASGPPKAPVAAVTTRTTSASTTTMVTATTTAASTRPGSTGPTRSTGVPATSTTVPATSTSVTGPPALTTAPARPTTASDSTPLALPDRARARRPLPEADAELALPVPEPKSDSLMSATGSWLLMFGLVWSLWRRRPRRG